MSRCFPYPPPGYVCNRATGDALIKSIKIEKKKEKLKQEKKEHKRREKELKKKEKKEKEMLESSIQRTEGANKRKRDSDGFDHLVKRSSSYNSNEVYLQKKSEPESEQLERSSLTEEYGQPIVFESLCYSSDGTQSNTKCKIEQSSSNGSRTTQGKLIRFRLKRREHESAHAVDDVPSSSGRTNEPKDTEYVIPRPNEHLAFNEPSAKQDTTVLIPCSSQVNSASSPKSVYEYLFSDWVPPPIHFDTMEVDNDDGNWLLSSKKQAAHGGSSLKAYDGLAGRQIVSLQPRAHLLPEVDLFVLPYAVPF